MNPSPIDLTTLDAVKSFAAVKSTGDDDLIQAAITGISQHLLLLTGRDSLSGVATYTEVYDGNGGYRMYIRNSPILSIASLLINGAPVTPSSGYGSAGYFIEQDKRSIAIRGSGNGSFTSTMYPSYGMPYCFFKDIGNIQITYSAGYVTTALNEIDAIANQTISLQNPGWFSDGGVLYYPSLTALQVIGSNPAAGQYAVSNGLYVFNSADNGKEIAVSYQYSAGAPPDLEYAVRQAVAINYKRKEYRDHASKGISAGGGNSTTSYRDWKYPPEVSGVIQQYKRFAIV